MYGKVTCRMQARPVCHNKVAILLILFRSHFPGKGEQTNPPQCGSGSCQILQLGTISQFARLKQTLSRYIVFGFGFGLCLNQSHNLQDCYWRTVCHLHIKYLDLDCAWTNLTIYKITKGQLFVTCIYPKYWLLKLHVASFLQREKSFAIIIVKANPVGLGVKQWLQIDDKTWKFLR